MRHDVGEPVPLRVQLNPRDRILRDIHRRHLVAARRERQREAAVVAERVQQASARVAARRLAVLALIEERAGLLAGRQCGDVGDAPFADHDLIRHDAVQHLHAAGQALVAPHRRIVAREDSPGREPLHQHVDDLRAPRLEPRGQELHHEHVLVAVHHQRRKAIRLPVHHPPRRGVLA